MKRGIVSALVSAAVLMFAASSAIAAGFRIPESGAKAMGTANAFVGQADDPSAVHHNPAGLTGLEGTQVMVGMTMIQPTSDFEFFLGGKSETEDATFLPPYFFYSNNIGEGDWWIGFGVNAPFGLGTEWGSDAIFNGALEAFVDSALAGVPLVTETTLEIVKIAPVAAYKVNDQFAVGFGPEYYMVKTLKYDGGSSTGPYSLEGDGAGLGFVLSAFYDLDALSIGFAWHTGASPEVDVDVLNFPTDTFGVTHSGSASGDLNLPDTMALGVRYAFNDKVAMNLDMDLTKWSNYDKLVFKDGSTTVRTVNKDYEDVTAIRIGIDYKIDDQWTIRGGYLSEPSPAPDETYDPRLPDSDGTAFVIGGGYNAGQWEINAAYMLLTKESRDVNSNEPLPGIFDLPYDGTYSSEVSLLGMDLTYRF
ncbi:MAG: outer membrane protein transport protein [bacterium]|nr:outer membrane protein transport protein [bacterium]